MASPTNHFKLGLFVLAGVACLVGAVVAFGARNQHKDTVAFHTYFNESVTGLEVGAPVRFRGVNIGQVATIEIAEDHRMVDVRSEILVADITRMGITEQGPPSNVVYALPPDLRAQLGSQGITGVKFVSMDLFDRKANPLPVLPFTAARNYVPAASSLFKSLEDTVTNAMIKLPELIDAIVAIAGKVDRVMAALEKDDVTGKAAATLGHVDQVLASMHVAVAHLDGQHLPERAATTIDDVRAGIKKLDAVLDRIGGDAGLVASSQRTMDAYGDVGRGARGASGELSATLREVREAAEALRALVAALERDPEMLVKGRQRTRVP